MESTCGTKHGAPSQSSGESKPASSSLAPTHRYVHHVGAGLGAGQHGGHAGPGRVVRVHVNGHVWETVPQSPDQEPGGLRLQQAGHVLRIQIEPEIKPERTPSWLRATELKEIDFRHLLALAGDGGPSTKCCRRAQIGSVNKNQSRKSTLAV